jgi:hypothetical protein
MKLRLALAATLAALALPAAAIGQRADLAIYDRATGAELPVHWHEGRAYVVGRPGNEYQVIVRNRRGEDLLAVLSVDGVNVVNGETASPKQSGYVLSPWERLDVRGWRKSLQETAAFYFTSLGDSYAGRTGRPANVGVIGVALFNRKAVHYQAPPARWPHRPRAEPLEDSVPEPLSKESSGPVNTPPPPAAPAEAASAERRAGDAAGLGIDAARSSRHAPMPQSSAPLGTGHGRRENSEARQVAFERASDHPVETIVIHYDSYRNLVAQGVLQAPIARRSPDPFPMRFTPDP